jgi:phenylacetate 2-hydroxylase
MLDLETSRMVQGLFEASKTGKPIAPHIYQKRLALNIVLMFSYGRRFEDIADPMLVRILDDAKIISRSAPFALQMSSTLRGLTNHIRSFRSTNANAQDYVPYLRSSLFRDASRSDAANQVRGRRDKWLAALLQEVKESIVAEGSRTCVASGLLADTQESLTKGEWE